MNRPKLPQAAILLLLAAGSLAPPAAAQATRGNGPWRLSEALETPEWFELTGYVHTRYESLNHRLRLGESGSNQGFFLRSLLELALHDTFLDVHAELIDARIANEPADARVTTGQVDSVELLQGYLAARLEDTFTPGDRLRVQLGRHTMDLGSRRLVARNRYRNTINAFTGLHAQWHGAQGDSVRAFFTLPVQRLPGNGDGSQLAENDIQFDEERKSVRFFGLFGEFQDAGFGGDLELYFLGLNESDAPDLATRNRNLKTFGGRWLTEPARGKFHVELETAFQHGRSRASTGSADSLDHRAYLHHGSVGYTFDAGGSPRLEALFDMASGDRDPSDGRFERFDSLYGIPRQDFGPTGIFRDVARSNLVSPGLRFQYRFRPRCDVMALYRVNYLASDRDAWTTTGIVDPAGRSGAHIGDLSEVRVRYDLVPDSVQLEVGVAYHAAGSFSKAAGDVNSGRDALFGYVQTSFWL